MRVLPKKVHRLGNLNSPGKDGTGLFRNITNLTCNGDFRPTLTGIQLLRSCIVLYRKFIRCWIAWVSYKYFVNYIQG